MLEKNYINDVLRLGGKVISAQEFFEIWRTCDPRDEFYVVVDAETGAQIRHECAVHGMPITYHMPAGRHYPVALLFSDVGYVDWDVVADEDRGVIDADDWVDYGGDTVLENGINSCRCGHAASTWHLFAIGSPPPPVNVEELI